MMGETVFCDFLMCINRICPKEAKLGSLPVNGHGYCEFHLTKKCITCKEQATHQCHGRLPSKILCGRPVCDNCTCVCGNKDELL